MQPAILWNELYAPFRQAGSDTVLTCSPTDVMLHTCAADVIHQVTERRTDFPKPTERYQIIDIYGKSVISVEGHVWKNHRKVTAGSFNEQNNDAVWSESIHQTQKLLSYVLPGNRQSSNTLKNTEDLASRTALAIISKAGFGIRMDWTKSNDDIDNLIDKKGSETSVLSADWVEGKTAGHKMSYADAILSVSTDVMWLLVFSRSLLTYFPFDSARRVAQAYVDWGQYMREMVATKRHTLENAGDSQSQGTDLLTNLVRSARDAQNSDQDEATEKSKVGIEDFSDNEILGNAFLMIMAGHETTAGVLHTALLLLAMHVDSQRLLQDEVGRLFGNKPPSEWDYKRDFTLGFNGMIGAVLSETLRWTPPVSGIPKWAPTAQPLNVNGAKCSVPQGTVITLHVPAAHRNPNQWPHGAPSRPEDLEHAPSNPDDDLGEFKPQRWLLRRDASSDQPFPKADEPGVRYATGTAPGLYRPPRGAYLPFSEGSRACSGRRFSQVEMVAILAVIFQNYSVELAVDEWASDEDVQLMSDEQRRELWCKARATAKWKFRTKMKFLMTNRMSEAHVPIRFVRRGSERFAAESW